MKNTVNQIEIVVKVKDQASAEAAAIAEKVRAEMAAASSGTSGGTGIKVPVEADTEHFEQSMHAAMDDGARVAESGAQDMSRAFGDAESGTRRLDEALRDAESASREAGNAADDAGQKASSSGGGFRFGALGMTSMISAALALAPALAALPAVGAAITVGLGTMAAGFSGITSALKDYGAQSVSAGASGAQGAQTAFSNAIAIRNAEDAITAAKKQSAQSTQQSADAIYSAQERVAASTYSLQQSQQSLTDAEESLTQAQKSLTQAQSDATNQLVDLNNAAADSSLAVEQAELNLTNARENAIKVNSSALSTDVQKAQAQLSLLQATQALKDAQQKQIESQQAADAANKAGVNGMQSVVSAQQAVHKATEGVSSAQHGVASAALAQTDAQRALARAVQASADQQQASALAIAKAEQNLSDTYKQQQLAAAAAASAGGGAVDKFAQDMAKLTPAGRAFVNQLIAMKGGLDQLKATAQTSMLPGFMPLLKVLQDSLPSINGAVGQMGSLIGGLATQFATLFQSPVFRGDLGKIFQQGLGFAKTFGDGVLQMISGVAGAFAQAGPIVSGLADGFHQILATGIPEFFQNLVTSGSGAGQLFSSLGGVISNLLGPIGTLAGSVATALAPAIQVLASPAVGQALRSIATSIGQILIVLSPVITMFAQGLAGALRIVAPLLQSLAKLIQDNQTWLVPLAKAITVATIAWWGFNAALAANPLILIATLVTTLALALIYCYEKFQWFRDFVNAWWPELLAPFTGGVSEIIGHWNIVKNLFAVDIPRFFSDLLKFVENWWPELLAPFTGGVSEIIAHWSSVEDFFAKAPGRLASVGYHLFDWIPGAFKWAINTVIGWWDSLSFGIPTIHIPGTNIDVGGGSIGVPQIPYFARGGVLPQGLTAAIGDGGWEPMRLPDGTVVIPNANARQAAADGAFGGGGGRVQVVVSIDPAAASGNELLTWLRKAIRVTHGNDPNSVQKTLGQAF